jgi:hypothetical protein
MTQSDLQRSPSSIDEPPASSRRRFGAPLAAAVAVLAVVGGVVAYQVLGDDDPSSSSDKPEQASDPDANFLSGQAPTSELVQGLWRVDNDHRVLLFGEDGTFRYTDLGQVVTSPSVTGTWALDGDEITLTTTETEQAGCIGDFFTVRASLPSAGSLNMVYQDASTGGCAVMRPRQWVLERLLPGEDSFYQETVFSADRGWDPLTASTQDLQGLWLAEAGAGYAIELGADGEYAVLDGSTTPVDYGVWSFGDQELALTSAAGSPACGKGDQLVLTGMEVINPGTAVFRGDVARNDCQGNWVAKAWFLVPHLGS